MSHTFMSAGLRGGGGEVTEVAQLKLILTLKR